MEDGMEREEILRVIKQLRTAMHSIGLSKMHKELVLTTGKLERTLGEVL